MAKSEQQQFANRLRILRSIDLHELTEVGFPETRWNAFVVDPYNFLIRADDDTAAKLWAIIEKRMTR